MWKRVAPPPTSDQPNWTAHRLAVRHELMGCASSRNCRRPTELYRVGEAWGDRVESCWGTLCQTNVAMENDPFIDDLPINNIDFP